MKYLRHHRYDPSHSFVAGTSILELIESAQIAPYLTIPFGEPNKSERRQWLGKNIASEGQHKPVSYILNLD